MAPGSVLEVTDAEISPLRPRSEKGTRSVSASAMASFSRTPQGLHLGGRRNYAATNRTWRPNRRSTQANHKADEKLPTTTPPTVRTVVSRRKTRADSTTISMARPAVDKAKIPAHSQVTLRKKLSSPG